jgi:hypothetical protein
MVLLLSPMFMQGCHYHGYLLSFDDDFFGRRRREFAMNEDEATRIIDESMGGFANVHDPKGCLR